MRAGEQHELNLFPKLTEPFKRNFRRRTEHVPAPRLLPDPFNHPTEMIKSEFEAQTLEEKQKIISNQ
jgi:hypothetical protein